MPGLKANCYIIMKLSFNFQQSALHLNAFEFVFTENFSKNSLCTLKLKDSDIRLQKYQQDNTKKNG